MNNSGEDRLHGSSNAPLKVLLVDDQRIIGESVRRMVCARNPTSSSTSARLRQMP